MNGRAITLFWVLQLCLLAYAFGGSVHRQARQVATPVAFGLNGYCGGYNDVDCSSVCFYNGARYYQCRPDKCYCF